MAFTDPYNYGWSGELSVLRDPATGKNLLLVLMVDSSGVPVSIGGGTEFAEDSPHTPGDLGTEMLGVRRDADTSPVDADGDYHTPIFDSAGNLKVNVKVGAASGLADGATFTADTTPGTPAMGFAATDVPSAITAGDGVAFASTLRRGLHVNLRNASGAELGTATDPVNVEGTVTANQGAPGAAWETVGDVAQDAAIAGNPLPSGGRASSAVPTAMSADGDSVYRWLDRSGGTVINGRDAHDAALNANTNPALIGGRSSAAAPTSVSADGDAVRAWFLLNGAQATALTAAGALIGGDATNGLDVDVTRTPGVAMTNPVTGIVDATTLSSDSTWTTLVSNTLTGYIVKIQNTSDAILELTYKDGPTDTSGVDIMDYIGPRSSFTLDLKDKGITSAVDIEVRRFSTTPVTGHVFATVYGV